MLWVTRREFREHSAQDKDNFESIKTSLRKHDENVEAKHQENKIELTGIKTSLDGILALRPAIEAGLLADKETEYRKKLAKRVILAVVSTAATVGGLIPLFQLLQTIHVHFG